MSVAIIAFSSVLTTWLARGQNSQELTGLTGRTTSGPVLNAPRDWFQVLFGFGLSNNSSNGLPIDGNWHRRLPGLGPGRRDHLRGVGVVRPGECVLPAAQ